MVVSFDICAVLTVIKWIALIMLLFSLGRNGTHARVIVLVTASILLIINLILIPIQIKASEPYLRNAILVVLWHIVALRTTISLSR